MGESKGEIYTLEDYLGGKYTHPRDDVNMVCPDCFEICRGKYNLEIHKLKCRAKNARIMDMRLELQIPMWAL